jgi:hypothetical protein
MLYQIMSTIYRQVTLLRTQLAESRAAVAALEASIIEATAAEPAPEEP